VLYDHYHNHKTTTLTHVFQVDTALFVLLSGFTTGLQLRQSTAQKEKDPSFNWRTFLLSRAVGVFPILWLVTLLNVPMWLEQEHRYAAQGAAASTAATCAVLHVVALESWWR
jgi:peptidoglycan/LPS O-acetylase OafA/YrhL